MFSRSGVMSINTENLTMDKDDFMLKALELGADDVREDEEVLEIVTAPESFMEVKEALEKEGFNVDDADIVMLPQNTVEINDAEMARRVMKLVDVLEDHDDVQNVYVNCSIPDDVMDKL
jgi:transcriptional/translational regulatory protein YebC/TACO1